MWKHISFCSYCPQQAAGTAVSPSPVPKHSRTVSLTVTDPAAVRAETRPTPPPKPGLVYRVYSLSHMVNICLTVSHFLSYLHTSSGVLSHNVISLFFIVHYNRKQINTYANCPCRWHHLVTFRRTNSYLSLLRSGQHCIFLAELGRSWKHTSWNL